MEFKITKEQIEEIARTGTYVTKRYLKEILPEAFKTELEVGKWYKCHDFNSIVNYQGGNSGYGFAGLGGWYNNDGWGNFKCGNLIPATEEEVSAALIAEAKKRGYKKGMTCIFGAAKEKRQLGTDCFFLENNTLCVKKEDYSNNADIIFKDGKWAEILPTEKTVITREKALKILAKKLKVSPENIEIE